MKLARRMNARVGMAALAVAGAVLVLSAVAQQKPASKAQKEEPVLRRTSRLVLVSAIVRDKNGAPVTGLTRDDFEILDGGQAQSIATFSVVNSGGAPRTGPAAAPATPALASNTNTFTNREDRRSEGTGTVTVILFDMLNTATRDSLYGQQQVARFLQNLQPQDRVALYALSSRGVQVLMDFTRDAAPLLRALGRYRGTEAPQLSASDREAGQTGIKELDDFFRNTADLQSGFFLRDRVRRTVDALEAIANHLMSVPGRKNLVWVSGSFPISYGFDKLYGSTRGTMGDGPSAETAAGATAIAELANAPGSAATSLPGKGGPPTRPPPFASKNPDLLVSPEQEVFWKDLERAARVLNQANLAIYPVDARGLMTAFPNPNFDPIAVAKGQGPAIPEMTKGGPERKEFDTMNMLADRTGGRAFYNANEIYESVRQAIDESRVTYELGYYPEHKTWDGKFHEITVRVKRPGLKVRHRRGYFAVGDAPAEETQAGKLLQTAAESALESAVLGLRVRLEPIAGAGPYAVNVRIEMDVRELSLERQGNRRVGALALLIVQRKSNGESVQNPVQTVDMQLEPATYDKLLREGLKLTKRIQLELDAEELRIVVRDATSGATGSVYIPLQGIRGAQR